VQERERLQGLGRRDEGNDTNEETEKEGDNWTLLYLSEVCDSSKKARKKGVSRPVFG